MGRALGQNLHGLGAFALRVEEKLLLSATTICAQIIIVCIPVLQGFFSINAFQMLFDTVMLKILSGHIACP